MNGIEVNTSMLFDDHAVDYSQAASVTWIDEPSDLPSGEAARSIRDTLRRNLDALPGALFAWRNLLTGEHWYQYRPETQPEPKTNAKGGSWQFPKYFSSKGSSGLLPAPTREHLIGKAEKLLIPEGTLKVLSAASYADSSMAVVGIAGIQNWVKDGKPHPSFHKVLAGVREVWVIPDADVATKAAVWDACKNLAEAVHAINPEATLRWVRIPATNGARRDDKAGLDDYLAVLDEYQRVEALDALLRGASTDLPPRPMSKDKRAWRENRYFLDVEAGRTIRDPFASPDEGGVSTSAEVIANFAIVPRRLFTATAGDTVTHTVEADFITTLDDGRRVEVKMPRFPLGRLTEPDGLPRLLNIVPMGYGARLIPENIGGRGEGSLHRKILQATIEALPTVATQTMDRTGYHQLADGRWAYATPGRVITKDGPTDAIEVRLRDRGGRRLTVTDLTSISDERIITAFRRTWAFLDEAASRQVIAVAALGVIGLAAMGYTRAPRASVTLVGPPALGKSWWSQIISAFVQGGQDVPLEDAIEPTATMTGTSRALQEAGAGLHEAVAVYDDVRPGEKDGTSPDFEAALAIMRIGYNGSTARRDRLEKDDVNGGFQTAYHPPAVPIAVINAESLPLTSDTASALSRTLTIPTGAGLISWPRTGPGAQDAEQRLAQWYTEAEPWLVWAATVRAGLDAQTWTAAERQQRHARAVAGLQMWSDRSLGRTAEVSGAILSGFYFLVGVGWQLGAWDKATASRMMADAEIAIGRAAVHHYESYVEPVEAGGGRVLDQIRGAVAAQRVRLAPVDPQERSSAPIIGERRGGTVRLVTTETARVIGVTTAALRQALEPIAIRGKRGELETRQRVSGTTAKVIVIPGTAWDGTIDEEEVTTTRRAA